MKRVAIFLGKLAGAVKCRRPPRAPDYDTRSDAIYSVTRSLANARGSTEIFEAIERNFWITFGIPVALVLPAPREQYVRLCGERFRLVEDDMAAAMVALLKGRAGEYGTDEFPGAKSHFVPLRTVAGLVGALGLEPDNWIAALRGTDDILLKGFINHLITIRCHSYTDGYWADIARTYHLGPLSPDTEQMFEAVFTARAAALEAIRPGARASEVDRAARDVFESMGFGAAFKHPAGNGAGFGAIDHAARPRLHPKSEDVLQPGMVLKLEPGIYVGDRGIRKADMIAVTEGGPVVLSRFHWDLNELVLDSVN